MKTILRINGREIKRIGIDVNLNIDESRKLNDVFTHVSTKYDHELYKQLKSLCYKKSLFERFYDSVTNFLCAGKSFSPNELKPFKL